MRETMKNKTVTSIMRNSAESTDSEMKPQLAARNLSILRERAIAAVLMALDTWLFELKSTPCPSCEAQDMCDLLQRWAVELGVTQVARRSWSPHPAQLAMTALLAMEKWRQAKKAQS